MRFIVNNRAYDSNGRLIKTESKPAQVTALPDGFPAAHLLAENGFTTLEAVLSASDQELLDVDGIGPSKLAAIRAAQE